MRKTRKQFQSPKKLALIILTVLISLSASAQVIYLSTTFDPNKAFNFYDNKRTEEDWCGYDYEVEVGATCGQFGVYLFYGRFEAGGFKEYGTGVDFYPKILNNYETSFGIGYSPQKQKDWRGNWSGVGMYHARARISRELSFIRFISASILLESKINHRTDVSKNYVIENSAGLLIKFRR